MPRFGQFYCSSLGTIVPAQYGGLCCLFALAVTVFWSATVCPQSIDFLSTVHFCYMRDFWEIDQPCSCTILTFIWNQRSDLGGVSKTWAVWKNLALYSLCVFLVVTWLFILNVNMRGSESFTKAIRKKFTSATSNKYKV